MGIGALATISVQMPKNLTIAVLDNEHFGETGMQKSHTGYGVDLVGYCSLFRLSYFKRINKHVRN